MNLADFDPAKLNVEDFDNLNLSGTYEGKPFKIVLTVADFYLIVKAKIEDAYAPIKAGLSLPPQQRALQARGFLDQWASAMHAPAKGGSDSPSVKPPASPTSKASASRSRSSNK